MNQLKSFFCAGICLLIARSLVAQTPNAVSAPVPVIPPPQPAVQAAVPLDSLLKWDGETKEVTVASGTPEAHFDFSLTNISSVDITVSGVHTSCGCTAAKLPEQPWKLIPGTNGQIHVTMNLAGKMGQVTKTVTVNTDKGSKMLFVKSNILPPPAASNSADSMGGREANQKIAMTDRQAVFRGDCARCHAEPAQNKMGKDLYAAVCGVCHEAEHRATMVPDLHTIKQETNAEFWRNWITQGKQGTLMPAFSAKQGGILSDAQIESLVAYLSTTIPSKPNAQASAR